MPTRGHKYLVILMGLWLDVIVILGNVWLSRTQKCDRQTGRELQSRMGK